MTQTYNQQHNIWESASCEADWLDFLLFKKDTQQKSCQKLEQFIEEKRYLPLCEDWKQGCFPRSLARKHQISKSGSEKKRIVYSYDGDEGIFLKFIAFQLYRYEDQLCDNCYSFRRKLGISQGVKKLIPVSVAGKWYCMKTDIHNYFNSMDVDFLLSKLQFLKEKDSLVYQLLERILREKRVTEQGNVVREKKGGMAGIPVSAFFANIYLEDIDRYFKEQGILYLRYSDDILFFTDTKDKLMELQKELYTRLEHLGLSVNREKEQIFQPGEPFNFLGLCFDRGQVDLSAHRIEKTRAKIRRKARALRRWQQKKGLKPEKAAIGLIHGMNRKFFGTDELDFNWSRWYFPLLNVDFGLHQIDLFMQEYIRYAVTGRHYKGNYRIRYQQMKQWGYRSLVHEYWIYREMEVRNNES